MAVSRLANVGSGTTATSTTAALSTSQAPVGSFVIATSVSSANATEAQTQFTNNNSGWTLIDLAGPTGSAMAMYGKYITTAGQSCTITGTSGANKLITLTSYIGHDMGEPTYLLMKADHVDTGNQSTAPVGGSGQNQPGARVMAGPFSGGALFAATSVSYNGNRTEAIAGMTQMGSNPTTGTATTSLEIFHFDQMNITPMQSVGARQCTIGGTVQNPTRRAIMMVMVDSDAGITTRSVTDSSTLGENVLLFTSAGVLDGTTFTDTASLNASPNVTDIHTMTDTASVEMFAVPKSGTDTFTLSEQASVLQILYYNAVDDATQLDAATIAASMTVSDTLTLSDTSNVNVSTPTTDIATQSDAASINVQTTDSATQTEQIVRINQELTDTLTQSEQTVQIGVSRVDTLTLSESVVTNHPARDTATLSEDVSIQGMATDAAWLEESAKVFVFLNVEEEHDLYDEIKRLRTEPLPTEDPFPSKEPAYTRKRSPFRVLAQDIFTKRFLHLDVPLLGDPTLTYTLSGPNVFQSVLNWEAPSLQNLEFPLEPYRTWLHVEEDYEIRMSTILQPFIDDNKSRQRVMEGVGFSWYPKEIFYQGEEYKGIQVDPASVIRLIWAHIQSYANGNLGVVVSSTSTPVRIGTAPKNVEFETGAGESVAFEAGPYNLNWWEVKNLGSEIDKLLKETPIESYENSFWNRDRTDINHRLELGYPRVGTKQTELYFQEGMNLSQIIPKRNENKDVWKSDIIIVGAGEGSKAIRAYASENTGRLRRTEVLENQDITDIKRAQAIADFEKQRRRRSRYSIDAIEINAAHSNAPWGSFIAGDDILVEGTVIYDGRIQDWHRITSYTYKPKAKRAVLSLSPSESFTYGQISEVD